MMILGASVATLALAAGATTASGTTATASTSCGSLTGPGGVPAHIISSGVSCSTARTVVKDFARHVAAGHANGHATVDGGWRCTLASYRTTCKRGHAVVQGEPQGQ
jgi:hypothetical protein